MDPHYNGLEYIESERFQFLSEECAEVIQSISKILRHGLESTHPDTNISNKCDLEYELGHVLAGIELLKRFNLIDIKSVEKSKINKLNSVQKYFHYI